MDKLLVAALMAALGISKATAEAMIADEKATNGEALAEFNRLHIAKVAEIKETSRTAGYNTGKGEALTKFEDDLKEKFDLKSNKKGLDLVEQVIAAKTPDPKNPDSIPDDVIKKHPLFIAREKELNEKVTEAEGKIEAEVNKVKGEYTKKETEAVVLDSAVKTATKLKAAFSQKPEVAARQMNVFKRELLAKGYDFEVRGKGDNQTILFKYAEDIDGHKKGERVEDAHGSPLTLEAVVKEAVLDSGLDFAIADPKRSLGGGDGKGGKNTPEKTGEDGEEKPKYSGKMPTTEAELVKIITDKTIPIDQRNEVQSAWDESQTADEG